MIQAGYKPTAELIGAHSRPGCRRGVVALLVLGASLIARSSFMLIWLASSLDGDPVGSLALLMLQHLTGGAWGLIIRRVLEASTRTLPLILLLFIPRSRWLSQIYPWTNRAEMNQFRHCVRSAHYLRSAILYRPRCLYFAIWSLFALLLKLALAATGPNERR